MRRFRYLSIPILFLSLYLVQGWVASGFHLCIEEDGSVVLERTEERCCGRMPCPALESTSMLQWSGGGEGVFPCSECRDIHLANPTSEMLRPCVAPDALHLLSGIPDSIGLRASRPHLPATEHWGEQLPHRLLSSVILHC